MLIKEKELIEDISKGTNMKMEENRINKEQSENQEKETSAIIGTLILDVQKTESKHEIQNEI